jgi:hypothetical protein
MCVSRKNGVGFKVHAGYIMNPTLPHVVSQVLEADAAPPSHHKPVP